MSFAKRCWPRCAEHDQTFPDGFARPRVWLFGCLAVWISSQAIAQPVRETTVQEPPGEPESEAVPAHDAASEFKFAVGGGYEYGFESDIQDQGELAISRFAFRLGVSKKLNQDLDMSLRFSYDLDWFDFSEHSSLAAAEPWDDIHTLGFGAIFTYAVTDDWAVWSGPVLAFSRESGAEWGDSFVGGGIIGATWKPSKTLSIGLGFGGITQIEDDPFFFPVINFQWSITDHLRLGSQTVWGIRTGVELAWSPSDSWEFGFGVASKYSRFRLDDDGPAPNGVGVEEGTPVWLRVGYTFNDHIALDLFGGANLDNSLRLENSNGGKISDVHVEFAPFLGVFLKVQF